MIPDGEIISMLCSVLSKLDVGPFTIKVKSISYIVCYLVVTPFSAQPPQDS